MKAHSVLTASLLAFGAITTNAQTVPSRVDNPQRLKAGSANPKSASPGLAANYGKLPLSFEANQGQAGPEVEFLSHGYGHSLFLSGGNATVLLQRSAPLGAPATRRRIDRAPV